MEEMNSVKTLLYPTSMSHQVNGVCVCVGGGNLVMW